LPRHFSNSLLADLFGQAGRQSEPSPGKQRHGLCTKPAGGIRFVRLPGRKQFHSSNKKECLMKSFQIGRAKLAFFAVLAAAVAGWASYSTGQQARPAPRNENTRDGVRQEKSDHLDQHVAQCLTLDSQNEVAAARIAEKEGSTQEVKDFAATMVKDHEQLAADLARFAGENYRNRDARATLTAPGGRFERNAAGEQPATAAREPRAGEPRENQDHSARFMKIREEIADQCRATVQRELDSKQGKDFDQCYMGMQIGAHMRLVDELTVLARHVSPEFKPVLQKGLQTAQRHLDSAKKIMKDVNETVAANN
jgi:predicted outer membrane protein